VVLVLSACGGSVSPGSPTDNLIVNGNAEAAMGSTDGTPVAVPGWTSTGEATAIQYGAAGYPDASQAAPGGGKNFFAGGVMADVSWLSQTIDVSEYAKAIDGGSVTFAVSGWFGGYADRNGIATLSVDFEKSPDAPLPIAGVAIGSVTPRDRMDTTEFLQRSATGTVPKGTRAVAVVLEMARTIDTSNDGYVDNLSLVFGGV
jgi:hypothetical protein